MLHHADPDAVEAAIDRAADARRYSALTRPAIAPGALLRLMSNSIT
jgi:hypothetical protein